MKKRSAFSEASRARQQGEAGWRMEEVQEDCAPCSSSQDEESVHPGCSLSSMNSSPESLVLKLR